MSSTTRTGNGAKEADRVAGSADGGTVPAARAMTPEARRRRARLLLGAVGVVGFMAIAEIVSRLGLVNPRFFPPFSSTLAETAVLFGREDFRQAVLATLLGWAVGLGITALIGIPLGCVLGLSDWSYRFTRPLIEIIRPIPAVALIPLLVVLLGQTLEMKVGITVWASIWPLLFNTIYGVRSVLPQTKDMARSFGFNTWQVTWRIVLPSAAPFIATGFRLSAAVSLIVVITAEMLGGAAVGIGAFIGQVRTLGLQPELAYAATLVAGLLGVTVNLAINTLERNRFGWATQAREV